jgi:hypothetical protein
MTAESATVAHVVVFQTDAPAGEVLLTRVSNVEEASVPAEQPNSPRRRAASGDTEIALLTSKFLAGERVTCDDPEALANAIWELQDRRDSTMSQGQFAESVNAQKAVDAANAQMLEALKRRNQQEVQQQLAAKHETTRQEYEEFCQTMRQQEDALEAECREQVQHMQKRQREELDKHDRDWRVDPKQRQFNRASQKLRILRVQQQLLMAARRFDEAAQVSGIADRLAEEETIESHYQCFVHFSQSRALLEQRHSAELDTLQKACNRRRGELRHLKETGTARYNKRFSNLQAQQQTAQDPEKLWALNHRNDGHHVARSRQVPIVKTVTVKTFNILPLPPLPPPNSPRKTRPRGVMYTQSI